MSALRCLQTMLEKAEVSTSSASRRWLQNTDVFPFPHSAFAMYSLLARYAKIEDKEPGKASKGLDRYLTQEIGIVNRSVRSILENKRAIKLSIRMIAIFGACCVMADGVFTPAQSVLGAIQGKEITLQVCGMLIRL